MTVSMPANNGNAYWENFLGHSPNWYKWLVIVFLAVNPVLLVVAGPLATSWVILFEFIGTLMMALRCYPYSQADFSPSRPCC